jgi:hypothetical protein
MPIGDKKTTVLQLFKQKIKTTSQKDIVESRKKL